MAPGKLVIRPLSATFLRSVTKSGKMSPYVQCIIGDHTEKIHHLKKSSTDFIWGTEQQHEMSFDCMGNELITFEVFHKKKILKDKLIGRGVVSLSSFLGENSSLRSIPLTFEGLDAGTLQVEMNFFPDQSYVNSGLGVNQGQYVNTQATNFNNLQEPLISGGGLNQGQYVGTHHISGGGLNQGQYVNTQATNFSNVQEPVYTNLQEPVYTSVQPTTTYVEQPVLADKVVVVDDRTLDQRPYFDPATRDYNQPLNTELNPNLAGAHTKYAGGGLSNP